MDDIPTSLSHYTALVQASGRARAATTASATARCCGGTD